MRLLCFLTSCAAASLALAAAADKPTLPEGPGKETTVRICGTCHGAEIALGKRLTRDGWSQIVVNMIQRGAQGSDDELADVVDYLTNTVSAKTNANKVAPPLQSSSAKTDLPEGPGKAVTARLCGKCHSVEKATSLHQDEDGWTDTIAKMVKMGAQGSDDEFTEVHAYLSKNFGPEAAPPVNVNKADAVELESSLVLTKTEAAALIQYRSEKGAFKSIDDLRNIAGLDFKKIESQKSRIRF
jgi:competence protein ComEA